MTKSSLATIEDYAWQTSGHFTNGRTKPIDMIVLHHNAGTDFNAVPNVWITREASAHYQVGPSAIKACLNEDDTAWNCGAVGYDNNSHTIGIENVNSAGAPTWSVAPETQENCARLVAEIAKRRGIPLDRNHVKGHGEMPGCATACPGGLNVDAILNRAIQINSAQAAPQQPVKPVPVIPTIDGAVFRLYNPTSNQHMWSASTPEAQALANSGWNYEGVTWTAPKTGNDVHRLYNATSGNHMWSADPNEISGLCSQGWKDEGVAFHSGGAKAIYRLYTDKHFWSTDAKEVTTLVKGGWTFEGVAFYAEK